MVTKGKVDRKEGVAWEGSGPFWEAPAPPVMVRGRSDTEVAAERSHSAFLLPHRSAYVCWFVPRGVWLTGIHQPTGSQRAGARAPRAGVSPGASGQPPSAGLFPPGMCWVELSGQLLADSRSQRPKPAASLCLCVPGVCCDSYRLQGCSSNRAE